MSALLHALMWAVQQSLNTNTFFFFWFFTPNNSMLPEFTKIGKAHSFFFFSYCRINT